MEGFRGLRNPETICYANAVFQILSQLSSVTEEVLQVSDSRKEEKNHRVRNHVFERIEKIIRYLKGLGPIDDESAAFVEMGKLLDELDYGERKHEDSDEFLTRLSTKSSLFDGIMESVFGYVTHNDKGYVLRVAIDPSEEVETCLLMHLQMTLVKFPKVFAIQLKRFAQVEGNSVPVSFRKDAKEMNIPNAIDFGQYCGKGTVEHPYYLDGIILHSGDLHSGHYRAAVRMTDKDWVIFSDESQSACRYSEIAKDEPYILFYTTQKVSVRPAVRKATSTRQPADISAPLLAPSVPHQQVAPELTFAASPPPRAEVDSVRFSEVYKFEYLHLHSLTPTIHDLIDTTATEWEDTRKLVFEVTDTQPATVGTVERLLSANSGDTVKLFYFPKWTNSAIFHFPAPTSSDTNLTSYEGMTLAYTGDLDGCVYCKIFDQESCEIKSVGEYFFPESAFTTDVLLQRYYPKEYAKKDDFKIYVQHNCNEDGARFCGNVESIQWWEGFRDVRLMFVIERSDTKTWTFMDEYNKINMMLTMEDTDARYPQHRRIKLRDVANMEFKEAIQKAIVAVQKFESFAYPNFEEFVHIEDAEVEEITKLLDRLVPEGKEDHVRPGVTENPDKVFRYSIKPTGIRRIDCRVKKGNSNDKSSNMLPAEATLGQFVDKHTASEGAMNSMLISRIVKKVDARIVKVYTGGETLMEVLDEMMHDLSATLLYEQVPIAETPNAEEFYVSATLISDKEREPILVRVENSMELSKLRNIVIQTFDLADNLKLQFLLNHIEENTAFDFTADRISTVGDLLEWKSVKEFETLPVKVLQDLWISVDELKF